MTETLPKRICPECGFIANTSDLVCPNDSAELQIVPEDPLIGNIVANRYKIESRLGRGGMSVVYKAHHQFMERRVAIKMLRSELASDENSMKRLQIESKAISALKHPNIVPVYDFGMLENNIPFLVMEYLEGRDFEDLLNNEGPLPYSRALPIFISICDGLEHAHINGIIHRDIKPSNIIMVKERDNEEVPVIVDFGIAKMVDLNGEDLNKLTATGQVFGSPLYMSPEQCSAKRPDARSDVYAMGCVMYQALTGETPLKGKTPVDTMVKHIQDSPPSFFQVLGNNDIPTKVELCVFKALEKDPDHRFSSMADFSDALKSCMESGSYSSFAIEKKAPSPSIDAMKTFTDQLDAVGDTGSQSSVADELSDAQEADQVKEPEPPKANEQPVVEEKKESQAIKREAARRYDQHPDDSKYSTIALVTMLALAAIAVFVYFGGTIGFNGSSSNKTEKSQKTESSNDTKDSVVNKPGPGHGQTVGPQPTVQPVPQPGNVAASAGQQITQSVDNAVNNTTATSTKSAEVPEQVEAKQKHRPVQMPAYNPAPAVQAQKPKMPEPAFTQFEPSIFLEENWHFENSITRSELVDLSQRSGSGFRGIVFKAVIPKNGRDFSNVASDASSDLSKRLSNDVNLRNSKPFFADGDKRHRVIVQELYFKSKKITVFVLYINRGPEVHAYEFVPLSATRTAIWDLINKIVHHRLKFN